MDTKLTDDIGFLMDNDMKTVENAKLRARIAELEAALKPFIEGFDEDWVEALKTAKDSDWLRMVATAGTIRAARAALEKKDD